MCQFSGPVSNIWTRFLEMQQHFTNFRLMSEMEDIPHLSEVGLYWRTFQREQIFLKFCDHSRIVFSNRGKERKKTFRAHFHEKNVSKLQNFAIIVTSRSGKKTLSLLGDSDVRGTGLNEL